MIQDTDKLNPEEKLPSEIVTPKPENVTPERVTPKIESEADIDARLTQMLLAEAKADKERDEKRVQRQMAIRTLGDMGSVILDLVKGSEGARVDPRKVEQHYEKLDDDARKVYDAYRTRVDLLRKQQADRDKARAAQAAADIRLQDERRWREEQARIEREFRERENNKNRYIKADKDKPEYFIDFGNGETKSYKNAAEGKNVYGAIAKYLIDNGYIPEEALQDKDGNPNPIKTQNQIDTFVRLYLPYAMQNPKDKSAIYKIVFGKDKDFRDPLLKNIEESAGGNSRTASTTTPIYSFIPEERGEKELQNIPILSGNYTTGTTPNKGNVSTGNSIVTGKVR